MSIRSWRLGALLLAFGALPAQSQGLRAAGEPVQLFADGAPALHPVWSPDGSQLAFTRVRYAGLWLIDADGADVRQLSDAPAAGFGFAWSPDGAALVARTARYDGPRRFHTLTVFDATTGAPEALTEERDAMPALPRWAGPHHVALYADGALDVLAVDAQARTAAPEPVVLADDAALVVAAGGAVRRIPLAGDAPVLNVTPSPDGRRVAFERLGGDLFVLDLDSGSLTDLGLGSRPTWSPDGQWVAFQVTEDDGHEVTASDLVAARADGAGRVTLTRTLDRLEMNPSWSPDGRRIAFDDAATGALYLLPVTE